MNLPFFLIDLPGFYQQKKGTESKSQKIIIIIIFFFFFFCIRNDMHFTAPFWGFVPVITSITLRKLLKNLQAMSQSNITVTSIELIKSSGHLVIRLRFRQSGHFALGNSGIVIKIEYCFPFHDHN